MLLKSLIVHSKSRLQLGISSFNHYELREAYTRTAEKSYLFGKLSEKIC
jgi:hypothetical protein